MGEARAHVLTPSEKVPGDFFTLDGWSVSLVGNEVGGVWFVERDGRALVGGTAVGRRRRGGQAGRSSPSRSSGRLRASVFPSSFMRPWFQFVFFVPDIPN